MKIMRVKTKGSSQGIGVAIALGLVQDVYRSVLIARNKQNPDKVSCLNDY
jgi:short-subunit dehydrogenase